MPRPPSEKQLNYLKGLGYSGTAPRTSGEASKLIDQLKGGMTAGKAEKNLQKYHREWEARNRRELIIYLNGLVEMNADYQTCAGFRLEVDKEEAAPETLAYHKCFLPLEVACANVDFLMTPGLYFDDELERVPSKGKFVVAPGRIVEREKGQPAPHLQKSGGCLLVLVAVALPAVWWLLW